MRVGIFLDISNLYIGTKVKYSRKLDFYKAYKFLCDFGPIVHATAYGAQLYNEADKFIAYLENIGFTTKYKKPTTYMVGNIQRRKADWDVGITIDIVSSLNDLDIFILGSADGDFRPLVEFLREQGKIVIVFACKISVELKKSATKYIEIPDSLLEIKNELPTVRSERTSGNGTSSNNQEART